MAYSITEQPTTPNGAYTRLPYTVSSTNVDIYTSNFQYIVDVFESGSSNLISRLKQTPNPEKVATFDPSRIFQGELDEDRNWKVNGAVEPVNTVKTFTLRFGEEYSLSPGTPIQQYLNLATTDIEVFPAIIEPNNGVSYNFQTGSIVDSGNILSNTPVGNNWDAVATDPTLDNINLVLGLDDYHTITILEPDTDIAVVWWTKDETLVGLQTITSASVKFFTLGIGPRNLIDLNPANATYFDTADYVAIENIGSTPLGESYRYAIKNGQLDPYCTEEYTRFAFINKYGFWDYYNSYTPVRRTSNISKQSVTEPQLDYSSISSPYDIQDRGEKDYNVDIVDRFEITTDFLDKTNSVWLQELLESPSVYIQKGSDFVPIIITNSVYTANTNQARQKLFQYTINFEPANQPFGDWDIDLPFVEPVANTEYTLEINTDLDITTASIDVTDPFPGGIFTTLGTLNNLTGSVSGSVSESYSTTTNYTAVSNTTKLTTTLIGNVTSSNQFRVTGSLFVDNVLVSQQTQIKDFPLSFDFSYVGNFEYSNTAVTRVNLEEILPIPVDPICNFDLTSASIDDEIPVDERNPNLRYWYYKLNSPIGTGWTGTRQWDPFQGEIGNNGYISQVYYGRGISTPASSNIFGAFILNDLGYPSLEDGITFAVDRDINTNNWATRDGGVGCTIQSGSSLWDNLSAKPYANYVQPINWTYEDPYQLQLNPTSSWIEVNSITSSFSNAQWFSSSLWTDLSIEEPVFLSSRNTNPGEWGYAEGINLTTYDIPGCDTDAAQGPFGGLVPRYYFYQRLYTADMTDGRSVYSTSPIVQGAYSRGGQCYMVATTPSIQNGGDYNITDYTFTGAGTNYADCSGNPADWVSGSFNSSTVTRTNSSEAQRDVISGSAFYRIGKTTSTGNVNYGDQVFSDSGYTAPLADGFYHKDSEVIDIFTIDVIYQVVDGRYAKQINLPTGSLAPLCP